MALPILFLHNSVMFSDSSKGLLLFAAVWSSVRPFMGFSGAVVFLSELLFLAIFFVALELKIQYAFY